MSKAVTNRFFLFPKTLFSFMRAQPELPSNINAMLDQEIGIRVGAGVCHSSDPDPDVLEGSNQNP